MTDSLSIAVHAFVSRVSMSFLVDETLLPRQNDITYSQIFDTKTDHNIKKRVSCPTQLHTYWTNHGFSKECREAIRLLREVL